jgi:nucleotide-binding universal stress UspA family protein
MRKVLLPISIHMSLSQIHNAAAQAIAIYRSEDSVQLHLLSVQVPVSRHVSDFFEPGELRQIHRDAGLAELAPAKAALDAAGVLYLTHIEVGRTAETIARFATEIRCDRIVMGQESGSGLAHKLFGTLASEVRHLVGSGGACRVIGS